MKFLLIVAFSLCILEVYAQQQLTKEPFSTNSEALFTSNYISNPNLNFLNNNEGVHLISVHTTNAYFNRSYLMDDQGIVLSDGFMPSSYFLPNDNFLVISGQGTKNRDSFNPYGAKDMTSMIILSTFNTFISKIKIRKR